MFWESVLPKALGKCFEQRLPKALRNSKPAATSVKEVQSRIANRKTKRCTVGLEIHPDKCINEILGNNGGGKRRVARRACWCLFCWSSSFVYDD